MRKVENQQSRFKAAIKMGSPIKANLVSNESGAFHRKEEASFESKCRTLKSELMKQRAELAPYANQRQVRTVIQRYDEAIPILEEIGISFTAYAEACEAVHIALEEKVRQVSA